MAESKQRAKRRTVVKNRSRKIRMEAEKIAGRHILEKSLYKARVAAKEKEIEKLEKKLAGFKPIPMEDMDTTIHGVLSNMFPESKVESLNGKEEE